MTGKVGDSGILGREKQYPRAVGFSPRGGAFLFMGAFVSV